MECPSCAYTIVSSIPALDDMDSSSEIDTLAVRSSLTQANKQIDYLEGLLEGATRVRSRLVQLRRKYHCYFSSIERLPDEVLSLIFEEVSLDEFNTRRCLEKWKPYFNTSIAPMVLERVNRRWRNIAIQTSTLWSRFVLCDEADELPTEGHALLLHTWISRSGSSPLHFDISFKSLKGVCGILLDLLCKQIHRWSSVSLYLPKSAFLSETFSTPQSSPLLEDVKLGISEEEIEIEERDLTIPRLQYLSDTPNLRQVTIATELGYWMGVDTLQWRGLQELEFWFINKSTLLSILPISAPSLRALKLHHCDLGSPGASSVVLPRLESFEATYGSSWEFLDLISAPSLLHVVIDPDVAHREQEHGPFPSFLARAPLVVTARIHHDVEILTNIGHSTQIRHLHLRIFHSAAADCSQFIKKKLLADSSPVSWFPDLELLSIRISAGPYARSSLNLIPTISEFALAVQCLVIHLGRGLRLCPKLRKVKLELSGLSQDDVGLQILLQLRELDLGGLEVCSVG